MPRELQKFTPSEGVILALVTFRPMTINELCYFSNLPEEGARNVLRHLEGKGFRFYVIVEEGKESLYSTY